MTEPLYELAFYGRLVDGVNLETAKSNVTRLFKASAAQVDKMFAGGRVVIRNKLDKATADKYVAAMRKNGLVCEADLMGQKNAPQKSSTATASNTAPAGSSLAKPPSVTSAPSAGQTSAKTATASAPAMAKKADELKVLPLASNFSVPGGTGDDTATGFNLAGEEVEEILQASHLDLDPEGVRLSEHHEVETPVFSELESISVAPTGSDLVDHVEEIPPIVPDVSRISIAPAGSDMGQLKKDESIDIPDLSHLKLDDLPNNQ